MKKKHYVHCVRFFYMAYVFHYIVPNNLCALEEHNKDVKIHSSTPNKISFTNYFKSSLTITKQEVVLYSFQIVGTRYAALVFKRIEGKNILPF